MIMSSTLDFSYSEGSLARKKKLDTDKESNKITIKISGNRAAVLRALKKIESVFPLFLEGKEKSNDDGEGIHIFLTVACSDQEA